MRVSIRRSIVLVVLLAMLNGAVVFAAGGSEKSSGDGPVTITVWDWWYGSAGAQGELVRLLGRSLCREIPEHHR